MATTKPKTATPTLEAMAKRVRKLEQTLKMLQNEPGIELDLTPEQEADLDRRFLEVEQNPGRGRLGKEVVAELLKKYA